MIDYVVDLYSNMVGELIFIGIVIMLLPVLFMILFKKNPHIFFNRKWCAAVACAVIAVVIAVITYFSYGDTIEDCYQGSIEEVQIISYEIVIDEYKDGIITDILGIHVKTVDNKKLYLYDSLDVLDYSDFKDDTGDIKCDAKVVYGKHSKKLLDFIPAAEGIW